MDELEKKWKQAEIEKLAQRIEHKVEKSDGPGTAKGKILDYSEWHPMEIAGGLTFLAYIIHPAFFGIHFALAAKAVFDHHIKRGEARGLLKQIAEELHYYIMATVATAATLEALGHPTPQVSIRSIEIIKILLGA